MEPQFSDVEQRFVLAEALKKSDIRIDKLYSVLIESNIHPDWEHMLLPTGRDLSQCKNAFESLQRNLPGPHNQLPNPQPAPPLTQPFPGPTFSGSSNKRQSINIMPGPNTKRRKSGNETPSLTRDILPKPSNGSPMSMTSTSPAGPSNQKKRGRPSKADVERKQREAIERGDIIPPVSVAALPAGSQGQEDVRAGGFTPIRIAPAQGPVLSPQGVMTPTPVLSPQMGLEQGPAATSSGDSSAKKRRPRPRPSPKPKVQKPGEGQFSINPLISQSEQGERPFTSASAEVAQAGPIAAPVEVVDPPSSITSVTAEDPAPAPEPQPKPDIK